MALPKHQQMDFAGLELVASQFTGKINSADLSAIANLSGAVGTADNAMTAVSAATAATTDTSAALLTSVNTSITQINNNLADLQAKVNAILTALK